MRFHSSGKHYLLYILALGFSAITACNSGPAKGRPDTERNEISNDKVTEDTAKVGEIRQKMCFQAVSGSQRKDTLAVTLNVDGSKVTGDMRNIIFEKDSRKGTLQGELKNRSINAVWTFMQEGMTDTLNLEFQLDEGYLMQRPLKFNTKTGREQTDRGSDKWVKLSPISCGVKQ
jgi:hypothetical protein